MSDVSFLRPLFPDAGANTAIRYLARRPKRSGGSDSISSTLRIGRPRSGTGTSCFRGTSGASWTRASVGVGRAGRLRRAGRGRRRSGGGGGGGRGGWT